MTTKTNSFVFIIGSANIRLHNIYNIRSQNLAQQPLETLRQSQLYFTLKKLYEQGHRTFCITLTNGFDIDAANVVLMIRENNPECSQIRLKVVAPVQSSEPFSGCDRIFFEDIKHKASSFEYCLTQMPVTHDATLAAVRAMNSKLVAECDCLVCYDDNSDADTKRLRLQAQTAGIPVLNLYAN